MTQVLLRQHLFKSTEKWIKTESYWLHIKRRKGGVEEYFVIYKITIIVRIEDKLCASYYTKHFIWRFYFNSFLEIPLPILQIKWSETPGKWLINNSNQLSVILSLFILFSLLSNIDWPPMRYRACVLEQHYLTEI